MKLASFAAATLLIGTVAAGHWCPPRPPKPRTCNCKEICPCGPDQVWDKVDCWCVKATDCPVYNCAPGFEYSHGKCKCVKCNEWK